MSNYNKAMELLRTSYEDFDENNLFWRQIRSLVTAECIIWGMEVDTAYWDSIVQSIYEESNVEYERLDKFLCEDLI